MTSSPPRRRTGDPARSAAIAGAVAAFVMLEGALDSWSTSTVYIGFADGALRLLTSLPGLVLAGPVGHTVPVFLGLFLSLWLLLPVTAELRLPQVLGRSCVAAAVAVAGLLVVGVFASGFGPFGWFADYPLEIVATREQFENSLLNPWHRLYETVSRLLDVLPPAVLGGVLLWAWERRGSASALV